MPDPLTDDVRDLSISMTRANLASLLFAAPGALIPAGLYLFFWNTRGLIRATHHISENFLLTAVILLTGILVHELIHGLSWMWFGRKPAGSIRYGFNLKVLTPYAHCSEPMTVAAYRIGAAMPGLILGIFPTTIAIVSGNAYLMLLGLVFTVAAGGDALILWLLRRENSDALVMDHPSRAGCILVRNNHQQTDIRKEEI